MAQISAGLRGFEDLSSGLKALFVLESGFNVDTGTMAESNHLLNRQALVRLIGKYGHPNFGADRSLAYCRSRA